MIDAMQWFQLNGKKAMVTGGAAGLCYAMAEGLHLAGPRRCWWTGPPPWGRRPPGWGPKGPRSTGSRGT